MSNGFKRESYFGTVPQKDSEHSVETMFHKLKLFAVGSGVDSNLVQQMIQFVMTLFNERNAAVGILLPLQKE